jgi:hypothetical protein
MVYHKQAFLLLRRNLPEHGCVVMSDALFNPHP